MNPFNVIIDKIFNWSGGAYVGLSTLVINGMAIAEFASGRPNYILGPEGKNVIYIIHEAPAWYTGTVGIYTVILGLFWLGKPVMSIVEARKTMTEAKAEAVKNAPPAG